MRSWWAPSCDHQRGDQTNGKVLVVFYPHSEHFWQIKEGLLPEKGQDYAENQPDGKDDGVDAIVSVTVPNHLFNICTLFFQFHFTPEYNKKWPDLFMAANNLVAQANRNYRCLLPRRRKNTVQKKQDISYLIWLFQKTLWTGGTICLSGWSTTAICSHLLRNPQAISSLGKGWHKSCSDW